MPVGPQISHGTLICEFRRYVSRYFALYRSMTASILGWQGDDAVVTPRKMLANH